MVFRSRNFIFLFIYFFFLQTWNFTANIKTRNIHCKKTESLQLWNIIAQCAMCMLTIIFLTLFSQFLTLYILNSFTMLYLIYPSFITILSYDWLIILPDKKPTCITGRNPTVKLKICFPNIYISLRKHVNSKSTCSCKIFNPLI